MPKISKSHLLEDIEAYKKSLPSGKRLGVKDILQIIEQEPDIGFHGEDSEMVWLHWKDNVWQCDKCGLMWVMANNRTPEENEMHGCPKCLRRSVGMMEASEVLQEDAECQ